MDKKKISVAECPVCMEIFSADSPLKTPKLLTCGHTFCLACLKRLQKKNNLKCPSCRHNTKIYGGVESLNNNFALLELVSAHQKGIDTSPEKKATSCEACDNNKPIQMYCPGCNLELCLECSDKLHKMKAFRHHKPFNGRRRVSKLLLCEEHQEPLKVFCITCQSPICILCRWYGSHQEHDTKLLTAVISEKQVELGKISSEIKQRVEHLSLTSTKLFEACEENDKYHRQVQHDIEAHFFDIAKVLRDRKKSLLKQADELSKARRTELNEKLTELAELKTKLEEAADEIDLLVDGNPVVLMGSVPKINDKYEQLIAESLEQEEPVPHAILHFSLNDSIALRANLKEYGDVSIKKPAPPQVKNHNVTPTTLSVVWESDDPTVGCIMEISEGKEGDWIERARCGTNNEVMVVRELEPKTDYFYRLRCRYEYGWSDHTNPQKINTPPRWKFIGFATWMQNSDKQTIEQQEKLMREACEKVNSKSLAASGEMYSERQISGLPFRNETGLYLTFVSPGNISRENQMLSAVAPGSTLIGGFDCHNAHTGPRTCICVITPE